MKNQHPTEPTTPRGILQDAGEVAVLTEETGATRHRYAMVVSFNSEDELRRAIGSSGCTYRPGREVQERMHQEGPAHG